VHSRALARYLLNPSITPGHAEYGTVYVQYSYISSTLWCIFLRALRSRFSERSSSHALRVQLSFRFADCRTRLSFAYLSLHPYDACSRVAALFLSPLCLKEEYLFSHCRSVSPYPYTSSQLNAIKPALLFLHTSPSSVSGGLRGRMCTAGPSLWNGVYGMGVPIGSYLSMLNGWCARGRCIVR